MPSGTIYSLALSQQIERVSDDAARVLSGCRLFLFLAGTTTPATAYQTSALTVGTELPHPIVADSNGRIPAFWLDSADTYKARLTTSTGVLVFEHDAVPAIGPGVGGGGVDTTPPESIASTGDVKWRPAAGTLGGWVRFNGRTIGSATSGATERANADCQALFEYAWQTFDDTICPVVGGRGVSSAADWAANKQITVIDMRGRTPFGLSGMGNSDSGRLDNVTFAVGGEDTQASTCGAALHTLSSGEMPSHTHTATSIVTDPGHNHTLSNPNIVASGGGDATDGFGNSTQNITISSNTTGISVATTNTNTGGGGAHNNMPPALLGTWYWRL